MEAGSTITDKWASRKLESRTVAILKSIDALYMPGTFVVVAMPKAIAEGTTMRSLNLALNPGNIEIHVTSIGKVLAGIKSKEGQRPDFILLPRNIDGLTPRDQQWIATHLYETSRFATIIRV